MKNAILIVLIFLLVMAIAFVIIVANRSMQLGDELNEVTHSHYEAMVETYAANREIHTLHDLISQFEGMALEAQEQIEDLQSQNADLEQTIMHLQNPPRSFWNAQYIRLENDGRYLRYGDDYIHILDALSSAEYTTIFDGMTEDGWFVFHVSSPSISPCGYLLAFVVGWGEDWGGSLNIYDMRTGEAQAIELFAHWDDSFTQSGAADAAWLDEDILLVVLRRIHSRPIRGGTMYAFDIRNQTLTSLDIAMPRDGQILSVQVVEGNIHMRILEDVFNAEAFYIFPHSITVLEARRLISLGETRPMAY